MKKSLGLMICMIMALFVCSLPQVSHASGKVLPPQEDGMISAPSGATMRETPSRSGKKIKVLPKNTKVIIITKAGPKDEIENIKSSWFQIKLGDGSSGWVFGGLIECNTRNEGTVESNPEFSAFAERFFKDKDFQIKHVSFPLKVIVSDMDETNENLISLKDYEPSSLTEGEEVTTEYKLDEATGNIEFQVSGVSCGILVLYVFQKKENDFFLIEIHDRSV